MDRPSSGFERRMLAVPLVLGALFLAVLALFAGFLFRTMSAELTESVLAESRADAERIARQLASPAGPSYRVSERTRETELYLHSVLQQRHTVEYITVTDKAGRRIFEGRAEGRRIYFDQPATNSLDLPDGNGRRTSMIQHDYDIAVPIQNIGFLHVGVSKDAVEKRLEALRARLLRQAGVVALGAVIALVVSDGIVWRLLARNRRLERERQERERLSALGEVAAGLAHEIRNPLNALSLQLALLEEHHRDDAPRFGMARSEVQRLDRLVTDFLRYARPSPLEPSEFDLRALVAELATLAGLEARESGVAVRTGEIPAASVLWDRAQMRQVLWNLLRNAVEAASRAPDGRRSVELDAAISGDRAMLSVRDRGPGIPPEVLGRLPGLFVTTKKGGTGLGLLVAARIVQAHRGTLSIESRPGEGTCVRLDMPLRVEAPAAA